VSVLTNKWYGESNKLVAGLFSLARKMQPSIIFIDEIDSFLGERGRGDHEVTGMMKAEFMTCVYCLDLWAMETDDEQRLWDGLASGEDTRILVLGATNRPNDIDQAILRRMPKRFAVRLPDLEQRTKILSLVSCIHLLCLDKPLPWFRLPADAEIRPPRSKLLHTRARKANRRTLRERPQGSLPKCRNGPGTRVHANQWRIARGDEESANRGMCLAGSSMNSHTYD
jgi:hypothetical protein